MKYVIFNGQVYPENTPIITANNRGLIYGDGVFETIKLQDNRLRNSCCHFDRLFEGMRLLDFYQDPTFRAEFLEEKILELANLNQHLPHARIRLMVFRNDALPSIIPDPLRNTASIVNKQVPDWILTTGNLEPKYLSLNTTGLRIGVCPWVKKTADQFSSLKSSSYQLYQTAARYATSQRWEDALICNVFDRIIESATSNIFWIKNKVLYTPPLTEGPVAGTMRRRILQIVPQAGWEVKEHPLEIPDLKEADAIFLSNALYGIRWVGEFMENKYSPGKAAALYQLLQ